MMGENSAISWTDHTWNPWIGCQEVSPACDFCYAKRQNEHRQWVKGWGPHGERRRTSDANWCKPISWDRKAAKLGIRYRVFCASLADVFDNRVPIQWHADVWMQIRCTPNLDWMLLTKRPQNIAGMLPPDWGDDGYPNVWLGTTVENQAEADRRIPLLLQVPARVRFLSCEPLLGPVSMLGITPNLIGWVIAGGESGSKARPSHPDWFRHLRDQCVSGGVPFHFKQWGEWAPGMKGLSAKTPGYEFDGNPSTIVFRRGVLNTGRKLDGITWDGFPR